MVRDRSCTRKVKYGKAEARRVVEAMNANGSTNVARYKCVFCGHYHVGHRRGRKAKAS
jgi:hypothetical protein